SPLSRDARSSRSSPRPCRGYGSHDQAIESRGAPREGDDADPAAMDASDMHKPAGYGRKLAPLGFWLGRHSSTVILEGSDAGHAYHAAGDAVKHADASTAQG